MPEETTETSMLSILHRIFRCRLIFLAIVNIVILIIAFTQGQPIAIVIPSFVISLVALLVLCKAVTDRTIVTNRRAYAAASNPVGYRLNVIAVGVIYLIASCAPLFQRLLRDHN